MTFAKHLLRHLKGNPDRITEHTVGNFPLKGYCRGGFTTAPIDARLSSSCREHCCQLLAWFCRAGDTFRKRAHRRLPHLPYTHVYIYLVLRARSFPIGQVFFKFRAAFPLLKKKNVFCYCRKIPGRPVSPARVNVGGNAINSEE